jgi:hypothetical protein
MQEFSSFSALMVTNRQGLAVPDLAARSVSPGAVHLTGNENQAVIKPPSSRLAAIE